MRDARTIQAEELFERRVQAVKLHKKGLTRLSIADIVGVHRNTVGEWIKVWKLSGISSLKVGKGGRPIGSGRLLFPHEEKQIQKQLIDKCPDQLKLAFALWTRKAVQELIEESFKIKISINTVGDYLNKWGFTPQKPINKVYAKNEAQVRDWLKNQYPQIKRLAQKDKAEIHWGDETGLRNDLLNGRGYSPKGVTPTRQISSIRERVNMISSVTNNGKVRFMFYKETMNSALLIKFFKRLIKSTDKKVYLILDNLRVHHSKQVSEYLKENAVYIKVFYLPSYSPELNPDELLNNDLKRSVSSKHSKREKGILERNAKSHMRSIQKKPAHIKSFFQCKYVKYAS